MTIVGPMTWRGGEECGIEMFLTLRGGFHVW